MGRAFHFGKRLATRIRRPLGLLTLSIPAALLVLLMPGAPATAVANPLFELRQQADDDISPFTKWTRLMPRYEMQRTAAASLHQCIGKGCLNQQWEALLTRLHGKSLAEQMRALNVFFNRIDYVADEANYGISDYWQTPYELMAKGGDCEDYAIAKYISLMRLGVSPKAMRILVVHDAEQRGNTHAVLEVTVASTAYLLDNQEDEVLAAAQVHHYQPVYAINSNRWWSYREPSQD